MRLLFYLVHFFNFFISDICAYGPHHPRGSPVKYTSKLTQDESLLQDKKHIQEDLKNILPEDETLNMSPEELEFHYFNIHDSDHNKKLDGLEILNAIQHHHSEDNSLEDESSFEQYIDLIDRVLNEDDLDKDGYLSYTEYVKGRNRDEALKTR